MIKVNLSDDFLTFKKFGSCGAPESTTRAVARQDTILFKVKDEQTVLLYCATGKSASVCQLPAICSPDTVGTEFMMFHDVLQTVNKFKPMRKKPAIKVLEFTPGEKTAKLYVSSKHATDWEQLVDDNAVTVPLTDTVAFPLHMLQQLAEKSYPDKLSFNVEQLRRVLDDLSAESVEIRFDRSTHDPVLLLSQQTTSPAIGLVSPVSGDSLLVISDFFVKAKL